MILGYTQVRRNVILIVAAANSITKETNTAIIEFRAPLFRYPCQRTSLVDILFKQN